MLQRGRETPRYISVPGDWRKENCLLENITVNPVKSNYIFRILLIPWDYITHNLSYSNILFNSALILLRRSLNIVAIQIHDFDPSSYEVIDELILRVARTIHFRDRTELSM